MNNVGAMGKPGETVVGRYHPSGVALWITGAWSAATPPELATYTPLHCGAVPLHTTVRKTTKDNYCLG